MPILISIYTHKGGVGKTTFSSFASRLMDDQLRVLLVDGDPQMNLTQCIMDGYGMVDNATAYYNRFMSFQDLLQNNHTKPTFAVPRDFAWGRQINFIRGSIIDGHLEAQFQTEYSHVGLDPGRNYMYLEALIRSIIQMSANYDVVFIDLNPGLSIINQLILRMSHRVISLITPDLFSISGMRALNRILCQGHAVDNLITRLGQDVSFRTINVVPSMFKRHGAGLLKAHGRMLQLIKDEIGTIRLDQINARHWLRTTLPLITISFSASFSFNRIREIQANESILRFMRSVLIVLQEVLANMPDHVDVDDDQFILWNVMDDVHKAPSPDAKILYFVKSDTLNKVKIGQTSRRMSYRLEELNQTFAQDARPILLIDGDSVTVSQLETYIKRRFCDAEILMDSDYSPILIELVKDINWVSTVVEDLSRS